MKKEENGRLVGRVVRLVVLLVLISFVIVVIPAAQRVDFKDMPRWYVHIFENGSQKIVSFIRSVMQRGNQGSEKVSVPAVFEKKPLESYSVGRPTNRRAFEPMAEEREDVSETEKLSDNVQQDTAKPEEAPLKQKTISFKRVDNLGLIYLPQPKVVTGFFQVVNANEVKIGETPLFLYGIYAAPSSENGTDAFLYLQKEFADKVAECYIGAYAADGTATAICVCDGVNINQKLVELGYSKDVSLN